MEDALETLASPGRGGHPAAMQAAAVAFRCREALAELFRVQGPEQVVFTQNATHALNIALKSLVGQGSRVVISGYEHNAVTRPLAALRVRAAVAAAPLFQPWAVAEAYDRLLRAGADAAVCCHVSNVFGFVQPVRSPHFCRRYQVPLIVDASQSAGVVPLDMEALGAAFIAMPGHKGLYGPQGTGVLLCGKGTVVRPLLEGGTGSEFSIRRCRSSCRTGWRRARIICRDRPGLLAGVRYVAERGTGVICRREQETAEIAAEGLRAIPGIQVSAAPSLSAQAGVVSLRWTAGTWRQWARPWRSGTSLCARGCTVRRWRTAPAGHWRQGRCGPAFQTSIHQRRRGVWWKPSERCIPKYYGIF